MTCNNWVHHNNRNNCSGLTNSEFQKHCNDTNILWECDKCIMKTNLVLPMDDDTWINFNEINVNNNNNNELSDDVTKFTTAEMRTFAAQCDYSNLY